MLDLLPHPAEASPTYHESTTERDVARSLSQTARMTVREVGGFWAVCDEGRYHWVTASRVICRSPGGGYFQAYTRLSLPGGLEVRRVRGGLYRADRLGRLIRVGYVRRTDA